MTPPLPSQQSALQAQITALGDRMEQGFNKLEQIMTGVEGRVRGLEQREAGCQPIVTARMDAAWKKIDEHEVEINQMSDAIVELKQTNRLLTWLGGIVGSALLIWIVSQLMGLIR
jgi:hypothetical protein